MRGTTKLGYIAILVSTVLFGFNGTMSKTALQAGIPAAYLSAVRCTGAAIGLLIVLAIFAPRQLRISKRDLPTVIACGLCGAAFVQVFYFVAISRLPVGIALLFEFTGPVMVAVWTAVGFPRSHRKRLGTHVWIALGLVMVGLALVANIGGQVSLDLIGVVAGLGAAVMVAVYYVTSGHLASRNYSGATMTMWMYIVAAVFWAIARPWWNFPFERLQNETRFGPLWLACLSIIILGSILPYTLIGYALKTLAPTPTAIIGTFEPVFAGIFAWIILAEHLTAIQLAGSAVILAGIVISQIDRRPSVNEVAG